MTKYRQRKPVRRCLGGNEMRWHDNEMTWNITDAANPDTVFKCPPTAKTIKDVWTMDYDEETESWINQTRWPVMLWGYWPYSMHAVHGIDISQMALHYVARLTGWIIPNPSYEETPFFKPETTLLVWLATEDWNPDTLTYNNRPTVDRYNDLLNHYDPDVTEGSFMGSDIIYTKPDHVQDVFYGHHDFVNEKCYGICMELEAKYAYMATQEWAVSLDQYMVFRGSQVQQQYRHNGAWD